MKQDYLISNKTYDFLKRLASLGLPALATLYGAVAIAWHWDDSTAFSVLGTIAAITVFCGVLLKIADNSWNKSESKYDGTVVVGEPDPNTGIPRLELTITRDPSELPAKDMVRLQSYEERPIN